MKYGVLILAAGASTRMGTSKQLLKIGNQSLLRKTINTALAIRPVACTVVLGANYEAHHEEVNDLPVDIVNNQGWENGMGSSIKSGIQHLQKYSVDAFYILVCDQPYLTDSHLRNLSYQYENTMSSLVASGYVGTIGVPALFDWSFHEMLLQLRDEEGAKKIIQDNCKAIVNFKGGEIDLDTLADYENL